MCGIPWEVYTLLHSDVKYGSVSSRSLSRWQNRVLTEVNLEHPNFEVSLTTCMGRCTVYYNVYMIVLVTL